MSEIENSFKIARDLLAYLEEQLASGAIDQAYAQTKLAMVIGAIVNPPRGRGQPARGLGYGEYDCDGNLTRDDAQIVASLPDHKNSLTKAIRAHYPEADPDTVKRHAKRIRKHRDAIEAAGVPDYVG